MSLFWRDEESRQERSGYGDKYAEGRGDGQVAAEGYLFSREFRRLASGSGKADATGTGYGMGCIFEYDGYGYGTEEEAWGNGSWYADGIDGPLVRREQ